MKREKSEVKNFIVRKSKRVPLKVRFKVSGRDLYGNQFEDLTETLEVGGQGGKFPTKYDLRVGATLKLTGPKGFVSLVRVVWVKEDTKLQRRMIGFQLLEAREDWVVQSRDKAVPISPIRKKS